MSDEKPNFYTFLGVASDADKEEIKKAYRKVAMRFHPDREEGDAEQFRLAKEAFETLYDDNLRGLYDETGWVVNLEEQEKLIGSCLQSTVIAVLDDDKFDPLKTDVILSMRLTFEKQKGDYECQLDEHRVTREKYEKLLSRFKRKDEGSNVLALAVEKKIKEHREGMIAMRKEIYFGERLLEALSDYTYSPETPFARVRLPGSSFGTLKLMSMTSDTSNDA